MMYLVQDGYMSHIRYSNMTSLDKWTSPQWRLIAGGNGGFCRVNPHWRPLEGKDLRRKNIDHHESRDF